MNWINYYEKTQRATRCDLWSKTPFELSRNHAGRLVSYNVSGQSLMICEQCRAELQELHGFMNRAQIGPHESVMYVSERGSIRLIRIHFPASIPQLDVSLLDSLTITKFPAAAFTDPAVIVLHADMMLAAFTADRITLGKIATATNLPIRSVENFVRGIFEAKDFDFVDYLKWIVANEYTFNHLARRKDARKLLEEAAHGH